MEMEKVFSIEKLDEKGYNLKYGDEGIMTFQEDAVYEIDIMKDFVKVLNNILLEKEMEMKPYVMMLEFYQKLIADTLADKLSEIDNMYAMKKMMEEICGELEKLANSLNNLKNDTKKVGGCLNESE